MLAVLQPMSANKLTTPTIVLNSRSLNMLRLVTNVLSQPLSDVTARMTEVPYQLLSARDGRSLYLVRPMCL